MPGTDELKVSVPGVRSFRDRLKCAYNSILGRNADSEINSVVAIEDLRLVGRNGRAFAVLGTEGAAGMPALLLLNQDGTPLTGLRFIGNMWSLDVFDTGGIDVAASISPTSVLLNVNRYDQRMVPDWHTGGIVNWSDAPPDMRLGEIPGLKADTFVVDAVKLEDSRGSVIWRSPVAPKQ